jgi:hypothetical protein
MKWRVALVVVAFLIAANLIAAGAAAQTLPRYELTWGTEGTGLGQFNQSEGIAVGPTGNVYVVESDANRIQVFDANGAFLFTWGRYGTDDGQFHTPYDLDIDVSGFVYVLDTENYRIQKFDATGRFIKKWGSFCWPPGEDCDGRFGSAYNIAVDASSNVFVVDLDYRRVQKFDGEGTFLLQWGTHGSGPGQFDLPSAIAIDPNGDVYIGDVGRVQKFDGDGNFIMQFGHYGYGPGAFERVGSLGYRDGRVYACDSRGFQVFTSDGAFLADWYDNNVPPYPEKLRTHVWAKGMDFDAHGTNVYLEGSNRILKFTFGPTGVEPMTWGAVKQAYR